MPSGRKAEWEVRVHGAQRDEVDIDLITQIVMMLGRQLAGETPADDAEPPDEPEEPDNN
ncbi:MAG: hypothetical protein M3R63_20635 [Actinomycetota bacterium]|nr:hypothetical protein [Actinomycetota bacterium]